MKALKRHAVQRVQSKNPFRDYITKRPFSMKVWRNETKETSWSDNRGIFVRKAIRDMEREAEDER